MEPNFGLREEADRCKGKSLHYRQRAMWKITPALFTYLAADLFCIWRAVQWLSSTHFITAWECSFWEAARLTFYLSISKYGAHALSAPTFITTKVFHGPGSLLHLRDFGMAFPGLLKVLCSREVKWSRKEWFEVYNLYPVSVYFTKSSYKPVESVQDSYTHRPDTVFSIHQNTQYHSRVPLITFIF